MTVYADILVLLNILVDYFLLSASKMLLRQDLSFWRQLAGAVFGGFFSLTIFLPEPPVILRLLMQGVCCAVLTAIAAAHGKWKPYLRFTAVFFAVSCGYAGGMMALWQIFRPNGMVIHNSVVYFNISPLFLILFSAAAYVIILTVRGILSRSAPSAQRCNIQITADGRQIDLCAIADTGNSLEDAFGISEIIIADKAAIQTLFGENLSAEKLKNRYRALPCGTVSGSGLLDGWRCDNARVRADGKTVELRHPILALSKTPLGDDYSAVINPKILELL